jgi:hypothetical protein
LHSYTLTPSNFESYFCKSHILHKRTHILVKLHLSPFLHINTQISNKTKHTKHSFLFTCCIWTPRVSHALSPTKLGTGKASPHFCDAQSCPSGPCSPAPRQDREHPDMAAAIHHRRPCSIACFGAHHPPVNLVDHVGHVGPDHPGQTLAAGENTPVKHHGHRLDPARTSR